MVECIRRGDGKIVEGSVSSTHEKKSESDELPIRGDGKMVGEAAPGREWKRGDRLNWQSLLDKEGSWARSAGWRVEVNTFSTKWEYHLRRDDLHGQLICADSDEFTTELEAKAGAEAMMAAMAEDVLRKEGVL